MEHCFYATTVQKQAMMKMREHKTLIFQHRNEKFFARMRYFDELDRQIVYRSRRFDLSFLARKIEGKL